MPLAYQWTEELEFSLWKGFSIDLLYTVISLVACVAIAISVQTTPQFNSICECNALQGSKFSRVKTFQYGKGELEFESYMRMLDTQGANTGYPYKMPNIFKDQLPTYPAVQYPPIVPGMEGPPSDTDRSRTSNSQREAWFRNTQVPEQRISPPSARKSDEVRKNSNLQLLIWVNYFKHRNIPVVKLSLVRLIAT